MTICVCGWWGFTIFHGGSNESCNDCCCVHIVTIKASLINFVREVLYVVDLTSLATTEWCSLTSHFIIGKILQCCQDRAIGINIYQDKYEIYDYY